MNIEGYVRNENKTSINSVYLFFASILVRGSAERVATPLAPTLTFPLAVDRPSRRGRKSDDDRPQGFASNRNCSAPCDLNKITIPSVLVFDTKARWF